MSYTYRHPRPSVTVDAVVLSRDEPREVLLIQRDSAPFEGCWAFPGGFVDIDETAEDAVARELEEETGVTGIRFEQLYTSTGIDRDPRDRVISIAYLGSATRDEIDPKPASDARDVRWFPVASLPSLAFDHAEILDRALERQSCEAK